MEMNLIQALDDADIVLQDPLVIIDLGMFRIIIPQASSELILSQTLSDDNLSLELKKKNVRALVESGVDINYRNPYKVIITTLPKLELLMPNTKYFNAVYKK